MQKKNSAAVEMALRRAESLTPERRREIAIKASAAAAEARKRIPPAKRKEIAKNAGMASARSRAILHAILSECCKR